MTPADAERPVLEHKVLDQKVAVVTGSGRGLGLAYARALAQAGAAVIVNDLDAEVAEAAARSIRDAGGRAVAQVAAVGSTEVAEALVQRAVSEFGRLDILVQRRDPERHRRVEDDRR
jgi:NAD(P)-dependent dehydrogenase (short-subunit alcohol dehydrogenase family)